MSHSGDPSDGTLPSLNQNCRMRPWSGSRNGDIAVRGRTPPGISPPPLKRQRTDPGRYDSRLLYDNARINLSVHASTRPLDSDTQSNIFLFRQFVAQEDKQQPPRPCSSDSSSFVTSTKAANIRKIRDLDEASLANSIAPSEISTGSRSSSQSNKGLCRTCRKSSSKNYDPIIYCSSCQRPYHDGCRKPALAEGSNSTSWKCYECITRARKHRAAPKLQRHSGAPDGLWRPAVTVSSGHNSDKASTTVTQSSKLPSPKNSSGYTRRESSSMGKVNACSANNDQVRETHVLNRIHPDPDKPEGTTMAASCFGKSQGKFLTRNASDRAQLYNMIHDDELDKLVDGPILPNTKSDTSIHIPGRYDPIGCAEIPNTPTQRSSQMVSGNTELRQDYPGDSVSPLNVVDSSLMDIIESGKRMTITALCLICQKQRVFGGNVCRSCKLRKANSNGEQTTIPETPQAVPEPQPHAQENMPQPALNLGESIFHDVKSSTTHLFYSLPGPKAHKVVTRKIRRGEIPASLRQPSDRGQTKEPAAVSVPGTQVECQPEEDTQPISERVAALGLAHEPEAEEAMIDVISGEDGCPRKLAIPLVHSPITIGEGIGTEADVSVHMDISHSEDECITSADVLLKSTRRSRVSPAYNYLKQGDFNFRELIGIALLAKGHSVPSSEIQNWVADTFPDKYRKGEGVWQRNISATLSSYADFRGERQYGQRHKFWNFSNARFKTTYKEQFPEYCVSAESPVHGSPSQSYGRGTLYTKTEVAALVEKQLPKFRPRSTELQAKFERNATWKPYVLGKSQSNPWQDEVTMVTADAVEQVGLDSLDQKLQAALQAVRRLKSTSCRSTQLDKFNAFAKDMHLIGAQLCNVKADCLGGDPPDEPDRTILHGVEMPFERHRERNQSILSKSNIRHYTTFHEAFPEYARPSVGFWTQAEIEKKISEIKQRPSRKAIFGQRLAFARSHRQDVHNETDGRWELAYRHQRRDDQVELSGTPTGDVEMVDLDQIRTSLDDIFGLPKNPMPMLHEGQLAFRDGTLVNGRLPRSRVVFKVGKKFGGELTTSF